MQARKTPEFIIVGLVLCWLALEATAESGNRPESQPAGDIDYWLKRGNVVENNGETPKKTADPFRHKTGFSHEDVLPGVVRLSDGTLHAGGITITPGKDWTVWIDEEKKWRSIPPAAILSITAKVVQAEMMLEWRWKAMGEPEKVYTGKKYPMKRLLWIFHLADGRRITGAVKGQPLWIETPGKAADKVDPIIFHERMKGLIGKQLEDVIHPEKVIISRRIMDRILENRSEGKTDRNSVGNIKNGAQKSPVR